MNPYSDILKAMQTEQKNFGNTTAVGEVISVNPLKMRIGELEYEKEDLKFLSHVSQPSGSQDTGSLFLVMSLDEIQTFYILGRI